MAALQKGNGRCHVKIGLTFEDHLTELDEYLPVPKVAEKDHLPRSKSSSVGRTRALFKFLSRLLTFGLVAEDRPLIALP